jgi:hypothetical protein
MGFDEWLSQGVSYAYMSPEHGMAPLRGGIGSYMFNLARGDESIA